VDLTSANWQKSSYSGGGGGDCVEVATVVGVGQATKDVIAVRDSKDPDGPKLAFTGAQWRDFTDAIKAGEFGLG
jgi:hypothetical protein